MRSSRLPIELYEAIIGQVPEDSDKDTLRACCLACKALFPASRKRLYRYIALSNARTIKLLIRTVTHPVSFLPNPSPLVEHLHCQYMRRSNHYALRSLAFYLPEVKVLEFEGQRWTEVETSFVSGFRQVQSLRLHYVSFSDALQFGQLAAAVPSLTHLDCTNVVWPDDIQPMSNSLPSSLQVIQMPGHRAKFFTDLLKVQPLPGLRSIKLCPVGKKVTAEVAPINELFSLIGPSLQSVSLWAMSPDGPMCSMHARLVGTGMSCVSCSKACIES